MSKRKPRLAIVIGSGGIKCAAVIGVLDVLEQENIDVDMVVGCSGGAVFGAGIALGYSAEKMAGMCADMWPKDITKKIDFRSLSKMIFPRLFGFDNQIGVFNDEAMSLNLDKIVGKDTRFSDTIMPFFCVATDFDTGSSVVISDGRISKALRLSSGIPILFKPIEWKGRTLIDGGLSNPLPVDIAIQEGADIIIAVGFETPLVSSSFSAGDYAGQMFSILGNQLLYKKLAFYNLAYHSEIIHLLLEFPGRKIKLNDVSSVPYIIEEGKKEALRHINHLKQILAA